MADDEELDDPFKTENRSWPGSVRKSGDDEEFRESGGHKTWERRGQEEIEERRRRDEDD